MANDILENFDEVRVPKFKKIVPVDYSRMLQSISQMEEKGLSKEQAEIEAFYMNTGQIRKEIPWENQQDF